MLHLQGSERKLAAAPVAPAFLLTEQDVLVQPVSTGASMSVRLGMSVRAVTSRLWNRLPMDRCRRMLTSSTARGESCRCRSTCGPSV